MVKYFVRVELSYQDQIQRTNNDFKRDCTSFDEAKALMYTIVEQEIYVMNTQNLRGTIYIKLFDANTLAEIRTLRVDQYITYDHR